METREKNSGHLSMDYDIYGFNAEGKNKHERKVHIPGGYMNIDVYIYMYYCLSGWQRSLFFSCKCSLEGKDGKSFGKGFYIFR